MNQEPSFSNVQQLLVNYSTMTSDKVLYELLYSILPQYIKNNGRTENIRAIYNEFLLKYYPNETCIKSSFINQVLLQGKSHVTIFELPVGTSRVDLCKVNGKSIAYEIKTDLDNFNRLDKQLSDYANIFEYSYLICSKSNLDKVITILPENCGIYIYSFTKTRKIKFKLVKNSIHSEKISAKKQLEIFSKKELINHFKFLESLSKESNIQNIFTTYTSDQINNTFKQMLKLRYIKQWSFIKENHDEIYEIDYQWFYKTQASPNIIYNRNITRLI
ncbi:MAG: sce7726 family protein [Erysipelotrichaceae bacterium]